MNSSSSVMAPWFANQSCDAFTPASQPCELGDYVRYAVNVSTSSDVVNAINFARNNNIRFVIRNTGHDYLGRSTGAGSLSVWTHYLKDTEFLDWDADGYTGTAVKLGAGVQGFDALYAGYAQGQVIVTGECATVGVVGGYSQGGGHSALSTSFGLAADNTLQFEVVTAEGAVVTASRSENSDLFWALSGGGGGNWGVVLSATFKTFPEAMTSGATLAFYTTDNSNETFYKAIEDFHASLPAMVDAGAVVIYYFTDTFFEIAPLTLYNKTSADVEAVMSFFISALNAAGVVYTVDYSQSTSYFDHYDMYFGPLPEGNIQVGIAQYSSRLIPRATVEQNLTSLMATAQTIVSQGVTWIGVATNVSSFGNVSTNAVLPAWRTALVHTVLTNPWSFTAPWSEMLERQNFLTDVVLPEIEAVTPGSGAYMNEADFRQEDFQEVFFGTNYPTLLELKKKWDVDNFFWAVDAVGSEAWVVSINGSMCMS